MLLVPIHPLAMGVNQPPSQLFLKLKTTFLAILCFQAVVAVLRLVVLDIWGSIADVFLVMIGYYAYSDPGAMYLVLYGTACAINCFFDLANLLVRAWKLRGSYFDLDEGILHNGKSAVLILASVGALLGAILSVVLYKDNRRLEDDERAPLMRPSSDFAMPPGPGGWAPGFAPSRQTQNFSGAGNRLGGDGPAYPPGSTSSFSAFAGPGRRLESEDDGADYPPAPLSRPNLRDQNPRQQDPAVSV